MKKWIPWLIACLAIIAPLFAVTLPKVWVPGETIKAVDLNANFNALNNAYTNHALLSNLDYRNSGHTGFNPEGGRVDRFHTAKRYVDESGQIIFPTKWVTQLPAATDTEIGALYLFNGALYVASGTATGVPVMSGYTLPEGIVFYSGDNASYPAWHAFDASSTTYWRSGSLTPQHIGYQFVASKTVTSVYIKPNDYFNRNLLDWTLDRSLNGSTWVTVATFTDMPVPANGMEFPVSSGSAYLFWRINVTKGSTNLQPVELIEVDFREQTKEVIPIVPAGGLTGSYTFPFEFGVSSWTLGLNNGIVIGIATP